jgi:CelD/BcsL family acetyltransferase involved in cellulose biosynthesis
MYEKPFALGDHARNLYLKVSIISACSEFAGLEEEWEELYRASPLATPFQSWAWLYSWWEHFGKGHELRLVTVRYEDLLVGLLPLMLQRQRGFGRLFFVGTGLTDHLDVLLRKGWEDRISEAVRRALKEMDGWHVVDLQQLRPEAAAWRIFEDWPGPRTHVWQDNFPIIEVKRWDEQLMTLTRNHRSTARRTLRRVEANQGRWELAGIEDAKQAARRLVALHREAWRGRSIAPEHLTSRFEAHMQTAIHRMTVRGLGAVSELWQDEKAIVSNFVVFGRDVVGTYLQGASQAALQHYQVNSLYIWNALNIAQSRNSSYVDLLRGDEPYKLRWTSKVSANSRMIIGKSLTSWAPYAGYHTLYGTARWYKQAKNWPLGIKMVADRCRAVYDAIDVRTNRGKDS